MPVSSLFAKPCGPKSSSQSSHLSCVSPICSVFFASLLFLVTLKASVLVFRFRRHRGTSLVIESAGCLYLGPDVWFVKGSMLVLWLRVHRVPGTSFVVMSAGSAGCLCLGVARSMLDSWLRLHFVRVARVVLLPCLSRWGFNSLLPLSFSSSSSCSSLIFSSFCPLLLHILVVLLARILAPCVSTRFAGVAPSVPAPTTTRPPDCNMNLCCTIAGSCRNRWRPNRSNSLRMLALSTPWGNSRSNPSRKCLTYAQIAHVRLRSRNKVSARRCERTLVMGQSEAPEGGGRHLFDSDVALPSRT